MLTQVERDGSRDTAIEDSGAHSALNQKSFLP